MCICVWSVDHPKYALILAANRDEFLSRPIEDAGFYSFGRQSLMSDVKDDVLSGRDLQGGRTWIGINKATGRLAFLTNITEPNSAYELPRGHLVSSFLLQNGLSNLKQELDTLISSDPKFSGFNLLLFTPSLLGQQSLTFDATLVTNNGGGNALSSRPATYDESRCAILSNGVDQQGGNEWPKVQTAIAMFSEILSKDADRAHMDLVKDLFELLSSRSPSPPTTHFELRNTIHVEPFTLSPEPAGVHTTNLDQGGPADAYGTRLSTVVLIGRDGEVVFIERDIWTLDCDREIPALADPAAQRLHRFNLNLSLSSRQNDLAPISRLPPEILSYIFLNSLELRMCEALGGSRNAIPLSQVSRSWRHTALNFPMLWKHLDFRQHRIPHPEMIQRTGEVPITVRLDLLDLKLRRPPLPKFDNFMVGFLSANISRIQELSLCSENKLVERLILATDKRAPFLECVTLRSPNLSSKTPGCSLFGGHAPLLRELVIHGSNVVWDQLTSYANLTRLEIADGPRPTKMSRALSIFESTPKLQILTFSHGAFPIHAESQPVGANLAYKQISLNFLLELNLAGPIEGCSFLVEHLHFPSTTTTNLLVTADADFDESRARFPFLSSHSFASDNELKITCGYHFSFFQAHGVTIMISGETRDNSLYFLEILGHFARSNALRVLNLRFRTPKCPWLDLDANWRAAFEHVRLFTSFKLPMHYLTEPMVTALINVSWPALQELQIIVGVAKLWEEESNLRRLEHFLKSRSAHGNKVVKLEFVSRSVEMDMGDKAQGRFLGLVNTFIWRVID